MKLAISKRAAAYTGCVSIEMRPAAGGNLVRVREVLAAVRRCYTPAR